MSVKLIDRVWRDSRHGGTSLLVLLALADYADDDGTGIWPSYDTIARKARVSRRQAIRIVQHLIQSGPLRIVGRGPRGVNVYALDVDRIGSERVNVDTDATGDIVSLVTSVIHDTSQDATSDTGVTSTSVTGVTSLVTPVTPNPSITVNRTAKRDACASRGAVASNIEKADRILLQHASGNHTERAITRARCSEPARGLMRAFHALTGIAYTRAWTSACEEMAGAGVTADDVRAAWAESGQGQRFSVNSPHSLKSTAVRIASARRRAASPPSVEYVYDAAAGEYVEVRRG